MKNIACECWMNLAMDPDFVFLTGDLGFMALEPLQLALATRFINAGIAEQNMVSVAAGLAIEGMNPWVYSIAPFCYARPFEQIRNDVCQHNLRVKFVGNGGGYAYGPMGASHHALEDYGALLTLPNIRAYVPAFTEDLPVVINRLHNASHPAYLRLGRSEQPKTFKTISYAPWRKILCGDGIPILLVGPIAGHFWSYCTKLEKQIRPELWVLSELPIENIVEVPATLITHATERGLCVVEEHSRQGSVGQQLSSLLISEGITPKRYLTFYAKGYPTGRYGSQEYHREQSGLNAAQVVSKLGQSK